MDRSVYDIVWFCPSGQTFIITVERQMNTGVEASSYKEVVIYLSPRLDPREHQQVEKEPTGVSSKASSHIK